MHQRLLFSHLSASGRVISNNAPSSGSKTLQLFPVKISQPPRVVLEKAQCQGLYVCGFPGQQTNQWRARRKQANQDSNR
jgi:hypothetical protein